MNIINFWAIYQAAECM